jgi:hypothetical protein
MRHQQKKCPRSKDLHSSVHLGLILGRRFVVVRKLSVVDVTGVDPENDFTGQFKYAVKVTILQEAEFTVLQGFAVPNSLVTKLSSNRHRRRWQNEIIVACGL